MALVDFEEIDSNDFLAVNQFAVLEQRDKATRADTARPFIQFVKQAKSGSSLMHKTDTVTMGIDGGWYAPCRAFRCPPCGTHQVRHCSSATSSFWHPAGRAV